MVPPVVSASTGSLGMYPPRVRGRLHAQLCAEVRRRGWGHTGGGPVTLATSTATLLSGPTWTIFLTNTLLLFHICCPWIVFSVVFFKVQFFSCVTYVYFCVLRCWTPPAFSGPSNSPRPPKPSLQPPPLLPSRPPGSQSPPSVTSEPTLRPRASLSEGC